MVRLNLAGLFTSEPSPPVYIMVGALAWQDRLGSGAKTLGLCPHPQPLWWLCDLG